MPMQTGKSGGGFDLTKSLLAHKDDEVVQRRTFIDLPGEVHGIADLVEAKIGKYGKGKNEGKEFFYAAGTVVSPKIVPHVVKTWVASPDGKTGKVVTKYLPDINIEGQRTSIMISLCDRKDKEGNVTKTADDFAAEMVNAVKLLGVSLEGVESKADFLEILKEMTNLRPRIRFKFSTQSKEPNKDYPDGGVWDHNWEGTKGLEEQVPEEEDDSVTDNSGGDEEEAATEDAEPEAEAEAEEETTEEAAEEETSEAQDVDLDELAKVASNKKDKEASIDAQEKLQAIASDAGLDDQEIEDATDWKDLVRLIREKQEGSETEEEAEEEAAEEEEEWQPKVGEVYGYKLIDPKTKKPVVDPKSKKEKKPAEVDVLKVDVAKRTVTAKNEETGKTILDPKTNKPLAISWDDLVRDV